MKTIHTPLGRIRSGKKLLLSALAFALIGGTMSALVNNSSAIEVNLDGGHEPVYTTVGPEYFTLADLGYYLEDDGVTMRVADTSVADFMRREAIPINPPVINPPVIRYEDNVDLIKTKMTGNSTVELNLDDFAKSAEVSEYEPVYDYICYEEEYSCLQGKKVGETEIIVEQYGEEIIRIPLISVELTPKALNFDTIGKTIEGIGAIDGADDDLLVLRGTSAWDGAYVDITGQRSFSIDVTNINNYNYEVRLFWTIGDQRVGGGTLFDLYKILAEDQINHSSETENILIRSFFNTWENDSEYYDQYTYGADGTIVHWFEYDEPTVSYIYDSDKIILSENAAELSTSNQNKLTKKLPEDINNVTYKNISAKLYSVYYEHAVVNSYSSRAIDNGDAKTDEVGEFMQIGTPIKISLDASDAPELKAGYTRTYYAAVLNDGEIKTVEGTYDAKAKTVTFETTVFGDYAYGYIDEFVPTVPNTGSIEKVAVVATATFAPLAVLTFGAFIARNKKKASNKLAKKHNHFE